MAAGDSIPGARDRPSRPRITPRLDIILTAVDKSRLILHSGSGSLLFQAARLPFSARAEVT
jgi:hypothetical protein